MPSSPRFSPSSLIFSKTQNSRAISFRTFLVPQASFLAGAFRSSYVHCPATPPSLAIVSHFYARAVWQLSPTAILSFSFLEWGRFSSQPAPIFFRFFFVRSVSSVSKPPVNRTRTAPQPLDGPCFFTPIFLLKSFDEPSVRPSWVSTPMVFFFPMTSFLPPLEHARYLESLFPLPFPCPLFLPTFPVSWFQSLQLVFAFFRIPVPFGGFLPNFLMPPSAWTPSLIHGCPSLPDSACYMAGSVNPFPSRLCRSLP